MRLNSKTYPAFDLCEKGNFNWLQIDQHFGTIFKHPNTFTQFIDSFKQTFRQVDKKYYLSETFKESIRIAIPKILKDENYYEKIPSDCGVIFTENGFSVYLVNPADKLVRLLVYGFTRDTLTTFGKIDNEGNHYAIACSLDENGLPYNDISGASAFLNSTLLALYFIYNCDIEEKVVKPNEKYRSGNSKHFNESKSDITFLDCKWFTDIIREAPFRVKGHLRWQFHGEKKSKRKLIWIDEFEKTGYKRQATKSKIETS